MKKVRNINDWIKNREIKEDKDKKCFLDNYGNINYYDIFSCNGDFKTREKALKDLESLCYCYDCYNCRDCYRCNECINCSRSKDCKYCRSCYSCRGCHSCKECTYCKECTACYKCDNCHTCIKCISCNQCYSYNDRENCKGVINIGHYY